MLAAVTQAIFQGKHLVVEGGTGVGKSMAYLLPAALFAASKGQRVVISTNTINLQEQLLRKDIPALIEILEGAGLVSKGLIQAASLKGRSNYLCLRRWNYLARSESPSVDDARPGRLAAARRAALRSGCIQSLGFKQSRHQPSAIREPR